MSDQIIPYSGKLLWISRFDSHPQKFSPPKFGGVLHPPMIGFKQSVKIFSAKFSLPADPQVFSLKSLPLYGTSEGQL